MGWSSVIFFIWRLWRTVSGISTARTSSVKAIMATPKFRKNTLYNSTRLFIIGWMMSRFQMSMNICICLSVYQYAGGFGRRGSAHKRVDASNEMAHYRAILADLEVFHKAVAEVGVKLFGNRKV